jgi:Na+-driven multidrug efflux pump
MNLKVKAFILQLISFATLFIIVRYLLAQYTNLEGMWISITAFVLGTILAPQFQSVESKEGPKLFMKWIFMKEVKEIK